MAYQEERFRYKIILKCFHCIFFHFFTGNAFLPKKNIFQKYFEHKNIFKTKNKNVTPMGVSL
jgi:hypothetical protein